MMMTTWARDCAGESKAWFVGYEFAYARLSYLGIELAEPDVAYVERYPKRRLVLNIKTASFNMCI